MINRQFLKTLDFENSVIGDKADLSVRSFSLEKMYARYEAREEKETQFPRNN